MIMFVIVTFFYLIASLVSFIKSPEANSLWKGLTRFSVILVLYTSPSVLVCVRVFICVYVPVFRGMWVEGIG